MYQFWIECRRTIGLWLVAPLLILAWFYFSGQMAYYHTLLWVEASVAARNSILFIGPCVAAAAAWIAGRETRRGSGELLATVPQPPLKRHLLALLATVLYGAGVYLLVVAILFTITAWRATWGGPIFWPALIGLIALGTCGAIGFAFGHLVPSRFTAPLVGVACYVVQAFAGYGSFGMIRVPDERQFGWLVYLSPLVPLGGSPWYGIAPNIVWQQSAFLIGLGGLALGALAIRERRDAAAWSLLGGATALTIAGVVAIALAVPPGTARERSAARTANPTAGLIPFTPVCTGDQFPICVHPAYRPWLDENAAPISRVITPLLGLPGAPTHGEQGSPLFSPADPVTRDALLLSPQADVPSSVRMAANQLLNAPNYSPESRRRCPDGLGFSCSSAREAINIWLVSQSGYEPEPHPFPEVRAAAERFGALPEAERREWLRRNFLALREGRVTIEMLP